jgi:hypothetical protein
MDQQTSIGIGLLTKMDLVIGKNFGAGTTVMLCKNDMHSFCVLSICCVSSSLLQRYNLLVVTLPNCVFPSRCYIAQ